MGPTRGPAREQAILDATVELVAEIGYERVTVNAIAARAHASKATMYRKWPGKAELVADALRRHAEGGVTEPPDSGNLRGDLVLAVRSIAANLDGAGGGPSLLGLVEAIRSDPALRELVRHQIDERGGQDGVLICRRAAARGEAVNEARGPAVLGLAVSHLFLRTMLGGTPPTAAEQDDFVDQILLPLITSV
jgi:AcrR family transcriptional regulator